MRLTHPDRVYWPDAGVTKGALADYYRSVWPLMERFVSRRPLGLLRCPDGTGGDCFFQRHPWEGESDAILTPRDPADASAGPMVAIDGIDGLTGLVQGGALEIHIWQSTLSDLEKPDQIVMDLDPGEGVGWDAIVEAARDVRKRLDRAGLCAFVKTSGGKGLHAVAPLKPSAGWDAVKAFTKEIAEAMASDSPGRYVSTTARSEREGRILIDYLRNARGAMAVAPYSSRARAGATVSMPVSWQALGASTGPDRFTVLTVPALVADRSADPWADFREKAAALD